jgi:hypothetical protein
MFSIQRERAEMSWLPGRATGLRLVFGGLCLALSIGPASAQGLVQACGGDFMALCRGVPANSPQALPCLQSNAARLSPACRNAVIAASPPPPAHVAPRGPGGPPPGAGLSPQHPALVQACGRDFMAVCPGVPGNSPQAIRCLEQRAMQVSPNCRNTLIALRGGGRPGFDRPPRGPMEAVRPGRPQWQDDIDDMPPQQSRQALVMSCRRDFIALCRGVDPNGPHALDCLERQRRRLSPDCRLAIDDLDEPRGPYRR